MLDADVLSAVHFGRLVKRKNRRDRVGIKAQGDDTQRALLRKIVNVVRDLDFFLRDFRCCDDDRLESAYSLVGVELDRELLNLAGLNYDGARLNVEHRVLADRWLYGTEVEFEWEQGLVVAAVLHYIQLKCISVD